MKTFVRQVPAVEILEARIAPALIATTFTWEGDVGAGWDDAAGTNKNWIGSPSSTQGIPSDGKSLVFPASAGNKTNSNNIMGLDLSKITFSGDGYSIGGQEITLGAGLTANFATTGTDVFAPKITLTKDQTFAFSGNTGGTFSLHSIELGGKTLTIDNTFAVEIGQSATVLSGAGALVKNGVGKVSLFAGNTFIGPVQVNAGILRALFSTALGATGDGSGTTVGSGATLSLNAFISTLAEDLTLSGVGASGQPGALALEASATLGDNATLTGALRLGADAAIGIGVNRKLTFSGAVGAADDALAILTVTTTDQFAFANTATFTTELAGTTPGAGGHDQLKVIGPVNLGGAALNVVPSFTPNLGAKFTIVDNDGVDPIVGTFAGLAEGATLTAGGVNFKISYKGADGATGNDVVLTVDSLVEVPVNVTLSTDAKTATFTDRDGDLVTVKTTKGPFQQSDFRVIEAGVGGQLQLINLTTHPDDFAGAGLTITAKPGPLGGNGFVNVGYLNAGGIDLGAVKIAGDLGRINAGTVGGDVKVPALKSLDVASIGLLGKSTQAVGGNLTSVIQGTLAKLAVKGDVRDVDFDFNGASDGRLGSATIGGSVVATSGAALSITAEAGIGTVKILGDVRADSNIEIRSHAALGAVSIGGSISGSGGVTVAAFGQLPAPASGLDLAIKSLTVAGSVEKFVLTAGLNPNNTSGNADAAIGSITVGGDWIASLVLAGVGTGNDFRVGTEDDSKPFGIDRDNPKIFSRIGSFTVKGQAFGTAAAGDMFGVVAEQIGKAKVGGRTFAFKADTVTVQNHEAFFAAPTGPGSGTESPVFDFTIRELGSTTPAGTITGGVNLVISADGKTATFNDVDGDLVTVKRSVGTFVAGNLTIVAGAGSGGGQLRQLTVSTAPGNAAVSVTITAKPGPDGGNGFVNIGGISAIGVTLGSVTVAGDLGQFEGGLSAGGTPGTAALTAHSIGALGLSTGATSDFSAFTGGLGKLTVFGDVRDVDLESFHTGEKWGAVSIAGALIGSRLAGEDGIGSVKIGGSFHESKISGEGPLGAIVIGGDLIGKVNDGFTIFSFGQLISPAAGLDVAIKSLTVKGSVENALVIVGTGFDVNRDASIGAISVGRSWLASNVLVGANIGQDTFAGTSDDTQAIPAGGGNVRDVSTRFSTIASITIKGQALGTAAAGDSFGIVAEQIGKAKIGTRTFKFDKGERDLADAFATAPTGPGPAPDNAASDFFIREIVN
jgi:autotransporter-associated beta strand protein